MILIEDSITDDLYQRILIDPASSGNNELFIVSGYASATFLNKHISENTEAKKIIHSLEDDQKIVHNLSDQKYNSVNQENINNQINTTETEEKKEINSEPLIPMNSILYDIEIDAEVLEPFTDQNIDVYDSLTTSSKSSNTKKQESLFEPHFDSVVEEKVEPQIKENILTTDSHDDNKTQNEYIFNNLDESVLNIDSSTSNIDTSIDEDTVTYTSNNIDSIDNNIWYNVRCNILWQPSCWNYWGRACRVFLHSPLDVHLL